MREESTLIAINDLIELGKSSAQLFLLCAHQTDSDELRTHYLDCANRARKHAAELQAYLVQHGGKSLERGRLIAALHRVWLRMTGRWHTQPEEAWLQACSRAEVRLLNRYRYAIQTIQNGALRQHLCATLERHLYAWRRIHQMSSLHGVLRTSM